MEYENYSGNVIIRASQRFGKLKKLDVTPFKGDLYIHLSDVKRSKSVSLNSSEFMEMMGLMPIIRTYINEMFPVSDLIVCLFSFI